MKKPRDLGLLLWFLLHRVPMSLRITEQWIERAREHCNMSSQRLAELRSEPYTKYWIRMDQKRDRRLAYFRAHGDLPNGWTPPAPGEQDRTYQTLRMKLYWHTRAKAKACLRKRPGATSAKVTNAYFAARKIRSRPRRLAAFDSVESMLVNNMMANAPNVSFREWLKFQTLKSIRDADYLRLSRGTKVAKRAAERDSRETGFPGKSGEKNARA